MTAALEVKVASWNIHKGVGTDRRRDLGRTAAVIAQIAPDILALQEVDTRFGQRTGLLDLPALQRDCGLVAVTTEDTGPAHGFHGNLILLRGFGIEAVHRIDLPGFEPRGALIADLQRGDHRLRVVATHLGLLPASRTAQARLLMDRLDGLDRRPALLMGDLNEFRRDGGGALSALGRRFDLPAAVPSFPARYAVLPLDRIMAAPPSRLTEVAVHDTALGRIASDHLPIAARLQIGGGGG